MSTCSKTCRATFVYDINKSKISLGSNVKRLLFLFILFLAMGSVFSAKSENIGIAFVHGTSDHRFDADGTYWKREFLNAIAAALSNPDNHFVVHCDFSKYMWEEEAAGCLATQLLDFAEEKQINKLILYTHSNGANIVRWILSNPTYDPRFMKLIKLIVEVIAISPSSGGSQIADETVDGNIFEDGIIWLFGYFTDAVKQQRIGDMALYNEELLHGTPGRPALPVPFRVIVSSDVTASPFSPESYCNGYMINAGLKITQFYLDKCSDGILTCTSQRLAGKLWFYDWQKTSQGNPLSHNQSRHSCSGFEEILHNDLLERGVKQ